jgi:DNA-binding response OmpR family regulator
MPYHIMLVEDSASQATKITYILEAAGWRVTRAATAQEAFDRLQEFRPDLVLLDFYLPAMRGDEVCRRIRRNIDTRNLPVIMLTSEGTSEAELRGLDSGADDFVAKSADADVLLLRIRALLGKVHRQSEILAPLEGSFRSARLLLIDDSPTFLERLGADLESEGYDVEKDLDPVHAVERVAHEKFDVVVVDLVMPGMDGFEVSRKIDALRKHMQAPLIIVMVTSMETKEDHSRALEAGADDFVGKSSDVSILKGRIRALLRRKFFEEENRRILQELKQKELEAVRERAAKEVAEARAGLVEQLEATAEELRKSQAELQRANQAKDQFLAILSHELRTPLTPVLGIVSMRENDESLSPELREEVTMIRRNIELEARLIDDLLDLTRVTRGKLEIRCAVVDMRRLVEHAIEICRAPEGQAPRITLRADARAVSVWGDASRLTQVLWNLIRNAVKFTPPSGTVSVRTFNAAGPTAGSDCFVVEVADTGMGIETEALPRIFDAFEQGGRQVTRQFGGLGLGLAISKAITELHEGTLTAASGGKNAGATFTLSLPITKVAQPMDLVLPTCAPENLPRVSARNRPLNILLVEDHPDTASTMKRLLTRRGHSVRDAGSVAAATIIARDEPGLDLLISDLGLPDGSGYDVLREVSKVQPVRSIALSGFGMEEDVAKSRNAGFDLHLTKPVDFAALEAAIQQVSNG